MVQRKALIEGADFAELLGDTGAAAFYRTQANEIGKRVCDFWDDKAKYIRDSVDADPMRTANSATILSVLHGYMGDHILGPAEDTVLATLIKLEADFEKIYEMNKVKEDEDALPLGPAMGRYVEDVYDGIDRVAGDDSPPKEGHAWYLLTMAAAELHYKIVSDLAARRGFTVTAHSVGFFQKLGIATAKAGSFYERGTKEFKDVLSMIAARGESFVRRVKYHVKDSPNLAEQFHRKDGTPLSATDLTWSYASVYTANRARDVAFANLATL
jgi:glucoamylase